MAKDYLNEARIFVENWRKQNGLEGSKALPSEDAVPTYLRPYLKRVSTPNKSSLMIASLADGQADSSIMNYVTEKGFFLDGQGKGYMQQGGKFYDAGDYNPDVHGLPVPLAKNRKKLKIGTA